MSLDHAEQKSRAVFASLSAAGIGTAYHRRNLAEVAPDLVEEAKGPLLTAAREGRGITFVGADRAYDAAILTARALHLQGVGSAVVPLRRLVKWIEHDTEDLVRASQATALFILGFYDSSFDECPLLGWQLHDVEEFLNDRIDNTQAIFAQASGILARGGWWSDTLVRRIARVNSIREYPNV